MPGLKAAVDGISLGRISNQIGRLQSIAIDRQTRISESKAGKGPFSTGPMNSTHFVRDRSILTQKKI